MRALLIFLAFVAVFFLGSFTGPLWKTSSAPPAGGDSWQDLSQVGSPVALAQPAPGDQVSELTPQEERDIAIFREVSPSVVYISNFDLRRDFFSPNVFAVPRGTGSGFVWDSEGHIVTNYHVIAQGDRFKVALGGEDRDAKLVGFAPDKDLAILKVEAPRELLRPLVVGSSSQLMVGQRVLAIGNPFGLDQTLTIGIVSALGRELDSPGGLPIRDVIQTDAAINPGNSGGPLLDSSGRLIGINTAIYSPSGASAGIGFAVPVDAVQRLVPQLIEYGKPLQPGIGVELLSDYWSKRLLRGADGIVISGVLRGSPAARAGLEGLERRRGGIRLGDVIVAVNGETVRSTKDLVLAFDEIGIGGRARLTVDGEEGQRVVEVELVAVE